MTVPPDPPVSVKVALRHDGRWVLLKNDRGEWELPGGRIDPADTSLRQTARRECLEELGADVEVGDLVDAWLFEVVPNRHVVIVCFAGEVLGEAVPGAGDFEISHEHNAVGLFATHELATLPLPDGYRSVCMGLDP